ncbi:MAG: 1-deoxy-D-xylulose-5-phosphate reductoisomerase [Selenomonadaceae bacterium]|nr:1-deoxy-D-xylulose-5-phosphate reductoisomerase [Selenomonadaceae bacterium]
MKKIAVLGSTGSIGSQTLDVIRKNPDKFEVVAIVANNSYEKFYEEIMEFQPKYAVIASEEAYKRLKGENLGKTKLLTGSESIINISSLQEIEIVVTAMVGFSGLLPTVEAIKAKKTIALANKETLVVAGELIMNLAERYNAPILPVDSEHSAFFQCLNGEDKKSVEKLLLTASGGPFRGKKANELKNVSIKDVLSHPTWNMGAKITVDSATLVNKGFEAIEAKWLYDINYDQIEVVVHPESVIHSMVEFKDGTVIAELGQPDMRLPIQYALSYPNRIKSDFPRLDFFKLHSLTFEKPDTETFKGLPLAIKAGKTGGSAPCIFNAANEVAVDAFLKNQIPFTKIYEIIESTLESIPPTFNISLETLIETDKEARDFAKEKVAQHG